MSAGFLTTKVFQLLRSNSSEPKPELSQLASEIRLTLKWLGYEVVEKSVEEKKVEEESEEDPAEELAESPTARLRVSFKNDVEPFDLLLQMEKPKLIERHIMGYLRQKKEGSAKSSGGGKRFEEEFLLQLAGTVKQSGASLPVLEIRWQYSWPQLLDALFYPSRYNPIAVTFDRVVGRTSGPYRSMCRITIMSRDITCMHFLHLLKTVIPSKA
jgi:hypothetical protein